MAPPPTGSSPSAASTDEVWARVQLARNLRRPRTLEFIAAMADDFIELHGDRLFGDDEAMVAGLARIAGRRVVVIGQQKGDDTDENIRRNFGMPHPEGYRKAMRVMELAERVGLPVVTFVDVPGAHPGPESEERGIAEAIARSIGLMTRLRTPIVAVITGEGGSGGALAIAVGDVVIALENAVYSVISPEGCASILWRTSDEAATAAAAMRMSAADQHALGVIDIVVAGARRRRARRARGDRQAVAQRSSSIGSTRWRSCPWRPCSNRATGAIGRWAPTLRPPNPKSPNVSTVAWRIGSATCSTRPDGAWPRSPTAGRAMTRRPARRCSECPDRPRGMRATPTTMPPTIARPTTPPSTG